MGSGYELGLGLGLGVKGMFMFRVRVMVSVKQLLYSIRPDHCEAAVKRFWFAIILGTQNKIGTVR